MTKITSLLIIVFFFSFFSYSFGQSWYYNISPDQRENFQEISSSFNKFFKDKEIQKGKGWKQFKRWEWFWSQRLLPDGSFPDMLSVKMEIDSYMQKKRKESKLSSVADWKEIGPVDVPVNKLGYQSSGLGRVNVLRFDPNNNNILYAGSAGGGCWRSTNLGQDWELLPTTDFLAMGITDVAINPDNSDEIYIATGDANGYSMTRGYSIGVIKSTDGGQTWKLTGLQREIDDGHLIARLLINPDDPDIILAGGKGGVYRSTNGGDSWEQRSSAGFFKDMEFKTDDPNIIVATVSYNAGNCAIFKSTDGGVEWDHIFQANGASRIELTSSPFDTDKFFAVIANSYDSGFHSFVRSTDAGDTWAVTATEPNILGRNRNGGDDGGQGFYDLCIAASPTEDNVVYVGGINIWRTQDGGGSWESVTHWTGSKRPYVHADQHYLEFRPGTNELFNSNDGGVYVTSDNAKNWEDITDGMSIHQIYRFGNAATDESIIYCGTQDNGVQRYSNGEWAHIVGGDGMECAVDPANSQIAYYAQYYGNLTRTTDGGYSATGILNGNITNENGAWITPFLIDPSDPRIIYAGFQNVWKSTNRGNNWEKISDLNQSRTMAALAVAPSNSEYIFAANSSRLYYTSDGGNSWEVLFTPPGNISQIAVHPENPERLWVCLSGFSAINKVFEYDGSEWINITGTLPNIPVSSIVYEKSSDDRLYIGTDIGVFYRDNNSSDWEPFFDGMPSVVVNEVEIHYGSGKLRAATFGRGVWETEIIDCDLDAPELVLLGETDFCEGDSLVIDIADRDDIDNLVFEWSTGDSTRSIVVKDNGLYNVKITNEKNCFAKSETIHVTVYGVPELKIRTNGNNPLCEGDTLMLQSGLGFIDFEWEDGSTDKKRFITEAGIYTLSAWTKDGCKAIDSLEVTVVPNPDKPEISETDGVLYSTPATGYQWNLDGEPVQGEESSTFQPQSSGLVTVVIYDENGCDAESEAYDYILGVEDNLQSNSDIEIIPNPNDGEFALKLSNGFIGDIHYEISDLKGYIIDKGKFKKLDLVYSKNLNLKLSPGIYFIRVSSGKNFKVSKFIVR